jgi:hypothetical protein
MSHKVIDLASDEEKEKAGPIDLANSSDEDVEEGEDLQVACPKCTLLNAGDADQCVACGNQLREPKPTTWGRADGTPWSQKPKTGFRIPTRSDVDARKRPPPTDCKPVAASKRAKQLQAAGALRDIEKVSFPVRPGAFADDAPPPQQKPRFESLASLPSPGSAAAAAADAARSTASHAAAGLRSTQQTMRAAVDAWDTKPRKPLAVPPRTRPQTRSVAEMLNCPGAATVKPIRVPVPALGEDAWVLRGALGAEVRSWSKIYVPLIFCALGDVPECAAVACRADLYSSQYVSSGDDIKRATAWWSRRLSKWPDWIKAVRDKVILGDDAAFAKRFLRNCKGKTAGVFNNAREYGWLPHPPARLQEAIVREAGVDGELALACLAATAKKTPASQKRGPPVPQKKAQGEVVELSDDDDELVVAPPKRKEPVSQQSSDEDDFDAVFPARHAAKPAPA